MTLKSCSKESRSMKNGSLEFVAAGNRSTVMVRVTAAPSRHTA